MSVATFAADPQCVKPLVGGGGVGIHVGMNSVCTNSGRIALGVGCPGVGMNLILSLPCTSAGAVPIVSVGDVRVVGNGDVGGQVPSVLIDGDQDVSPWANVWDGPASSCAMEPMS